MKDIACQNLLCKAHLTALSLKEAFGATHRARLTDLEATRVLQKVEDFIIAVDMILKFWLQVQTVKISGTDSTKMAEESSIAYLSIDISTPSAPLHPGILSRRMHASTSCVACQRFLIERKSDVSRAEKFSSNYDMLFGAWQIT